MWQTKPNSNLIKGIYIINVTLCGGCLRTQSCCYDSNMILVKRRWHHMIRHLTCEECELGTVRILVWGSLSKYLRISKVAISTTIGEWWGMMITMKFCGTRVSNKPNGCKWPMAYLSAGSGIRGTPAMKRETTVLVQQTRAWIGSEMSLRLERKLTTSSINIWVWI